MFKDNKKKNTNIEEGTFLFDDFFVNEELSEEDIPADYIKKTSIKQPRLNLFTSADCKTFIDKKFKVKFTFYNNRLASVALMSPESLYTDDMINMDKYYDYIKELNEWAVKVLGSNYLKIQNKLYWEFEWGCISIPEHTYSYTGETMMIECGV